MNTTIISDNTLVTVVGDDSSLIKPYEELTIADDFVFGKIFQDKVLFKKLLEILLHIDPATEIAEPIAQKSFRVGPDRKKIATDVASYSSTAEYDAEMQQQVHKDLPRRSRYYQAAMDVQFLQRSFEYTQLKENFVLFICLRDPFGRGLPVYTFRNTSKEDTSVLLGDGTTKIFYNAKDYAKLDDVEAKSFMEYVGTKQATSSYTATLDDQVIGLRKNPLWRKEYLDAMQNELLQKHDLEAAEQRGINRRTLEIARNLKQAGSDIAFIAQITGLSESAIMGL